MKKIFLCLPLVFIVFGNSISFSQDVISVTEGSETTVCGKIVIIDALWVSEGILKADISLLANQNSKPITGGYSKGDLITLSSEPGCTYYIYSVTKYGSSMDKGLVTLSKTPPELIPGISDGEFSVNESSSFRVGSNDWFVSSISGDGDKTTANITVTQNTELVENITLTAGSLVWMGETLYKVEAIQPHSELIKTDPEKIYEPLPGKIVFKAVNEYLPKK